MVLAHGDVVCGHSHTGPNLMDSWLVSNCSDGTGHGSTHTYIQQHCEGKLREDYLSSATLKMIQLHTKFSTVKHFSKHILTFSCTECTLLERKWRGQTSFLTVRQSSLDKNSLVHLILHHRFTKDWCGYCVRSQWNGPHFTRESNSQVFGSRPL